MSNREQTESLVARIQAGEQDLIPELWSATERLVAWQANRIISKLPASQGVTFEDLYQSGYIALADTVERYEQREGGSFITLFMLCLKSAFMEACGARGKSGVLDPLRQVGTQSLNAPLDGAEDITLADTIADERDGYEDAEARIFNEQLHNELERALSAIPADEANILRKHYYQGATLKEVDEAAGEQAGQARQLESKGLHHLRAPKISRPLRLFLEHTTPYYLRVSVQSFNTTRTSSVEQIALIREEAEARCTRISIST